jgi:hypothetical protein
VGKKGKGEKMRNIWRWKEVKVGKENFKMAGISKFGILPKNLFKQGNRGNLGIFELF